MKAQVITNFGSPEVLTLQQVAEPLLEPGQVLIKVAATSVNPLDCKIRSGLLPSLTPEFPAILQGDVAGVVEAVHSPSSRFKVGDEVYGFVGGVVGLNGALAEYVAADEKLLAKKPTSLSMVEAAALPVVSITSWLALFKNLELKEKQLVLIQGGAGGVGHIALQLAKWRGAKVAVTVRSDEDVELTEALGADYAVDIRKEDSASYLQALTDNQGFKAIFDTVGGGTLESSFSNGAVEGKIVTTNARYTIDLTPMQSKGFTLSAVLILLPLLQGTDRELHGQILTKIAEIADEGQLKPIIDPHVFTLEQAADAHRLLESGKAKGKVVIGISV